MNIFFTYDELKQVIDDMEIDDLNIAQLKRNLLQERGIYTSDGLTADEDIVQYQELESKHAQVKNFQKRIDVICQQFRMFESTLQL